MSSYTATEWRMMGLLTHPTTFRWVLNTPTGFTSMAYSLDLPLPPIKEALRRPIGEAIWGKAIAPAISDAVTVPLLEVTRWWVSDMADISATDDLRGGAPHPPLPLATSPCIAMHSGLQGDWGTRRMHLGGARADIASEGRLTKNGGAFLLTLIRGLCASMAPGIPGNWTRALIIHPGLASGDLNAPDFPTWRDIEAYTVCEHLEKAPTWP